MRWRSSRMMLPSWASASDWGRGTSAMIDTVGDRCVDGFNQLGSLGRSLPVSCSYRCSGTCCTLIVVVSCRCRPHCPRLRGMGGAALPNDHRHGHRRPRGACPLRTIRRRSVHGGVAVPLSRRAAAWIEEGVNDREHPGAIRMNVVDGPRRIASGERRRHGRLPPGSSGTLAVAVGSRPAEGRPRWPGRWRDDGVPARSRPFTSRSSSCPRRSCAPPIILNAPMMASSIIDVDIEGRRPGQPPSRHHVLDDVITADAYRNCMPARVRRWSIEYWSCSPTPWAVWLVDAAVVIHHVTSTTR